MGERNAFVNLAKTAIYHNHIGLSVMPKAETVAHHGSREIVQKKVYCPSLNASVTVNEERYFCSI